MLGCRAEVISLDPTTLDEVIDCIAVVGEATGTGRGRRASCTSCVPVSTSCAAPSSAPSTADVRVGMVGPALQRRALGARHDRGRGRRSVLASSGERSRRLEWDEVEAAAPRRRRLHAVWLHVRPGRRRRSARPPRRSRAGAGGAHLRDRRERAVLPAGAAPASTGSKPSPGRCTRAPSPPRAPGSSPRCGSSRHPTCVKRPRYTRRIDASSWRVAATGCRWRR